MGAVACLRILLDGNRTDVPADALGPIVAKYADIFLEVRWTYPRQSQRLNHFCYLLSDPSVDEVDTVELANMSRELQIQLFGTAVADSVKLVLFQGDAEAITAFTNYSVHDVLAALDDPSGLPGSGRLRRIAPDGSLIDVPEAASSPPVAEAYRFGPTVDGAQGVYFPAREVFIGDVLNCTPVGAEAHYSMIDGEEHRPADAEAFDAACITTAVRFLVDFPIVAPLYIPVSFSTLVRPSQREAWLDLVAVLPASARRRLAATIYDVPRAPTWQALSTIRATLEPYFNAVDLCVRDPDFEIEQLAESAVASVTLTLPEGKTDVRLTALRRFAGHGSTYRRRRIVFGVTNIRLRTEREMAMGLAIPFISGPGICRIQSRPLGGRRWPSGTLPVLSTDLDDLPVASPDRQGSGV
jgi:hypothetical protein